MEPPIPDPLGLGRPTRRLLLVLVESLDRTDLELGVTLHLEQLRARASGKVTALDAPSPEPMSDQLLAALRVDALRAAGWRVCRRGLALRSDWHDDRASVHSIRRRARGAADVTTVWFRDAAVAAQLTGRHGAAHRDALQRTDHLIRELHHALAADGDDLDIAVCGSAPQAAVELSHDPRPLLRRALGKRDVRGASARVELTHAVLHCPSWPARQRAALRLRAAAERLLVIEEPSAELMHALDLRPGDLLCVPPLGQAFSSTPVRAAPRLLGDGVGPPCALHPALDEIATPTQVVRRLLACRTPALPPVPRAKTAADPWQQLEAAPDLLPGLQEAADANDEFVYLDDEERVTERAPSADSSHWSS